jgi:hypothetical protein
MLAKHRRPLAVPKKTACKFLQAARPLCDRSEASRATLAGAHLFRKQAAPACCASTGARAPEPTGLGSDKPWPPAPMLEVFYLFHVQRRAPSALAVSCSPDERAALWDGPPCRCLLRRNTPFVLAPRILFVFAPAPVVRVHCNARIGWIVIGFVRVPAHWPRTHNRSGSVGGGDPQEARCRADT